MWTAGDTESASFTVVGIYLEGKWFLAREIFNLSGLALANIVANEVSIETTDHRRNNSFGNFSVEQCDVKDQEKKKYNRWSPKHVQRAEN